MNMAGKRFQLDAFLVFVRWLIVSAFIMSYLLKTRSAFQNRFNPIIS